MRVTGTEGTIRVGGRLAARLTGWTLDRDPTETWILDATATEINAHWMKYTSEMVLCLHVGKQRWRWDELQAGHNGEHITATGTGKPEIRIVKNGT